VKDELKYRILKTLAETLDFTKTTQLITEVSKKQIQAFLFNLAETFKAQKLVNIYTDGAARGNPGEAGIGFVIIAEDEKVIIKKGRYIGRATNNEAEYHAILSALKEAKTIGVREVKIFADSELIVKQIKGEYRIKSEGLKPLYKEAMALLKEFDRYDIIHIVREKNKEADRLANQAIDAMAGVVI